MTIAEFKTLMAEMTAQADKVAARFSPATETTMPALLWKQLTPAALDLWTIPGVLEHIAACLAPPEAPEQDEDEP
jgi:hypothetical protein